MNFLIASLAPGVIIMYLIYRHDLEKEPIKMLIKAFSGGIGSIFLSLCISIPLGLALKPEGISSAGFDAFLGAALPEELAKWLIFYWIIRSSKHFDQYYDGILYAIFISMGFALVENLLYVFAGGMGVAVMRAVLSVPGHMLFAIPMGYYFSLSRFEQGPKATIHLALSIAIPVLLHGLFDFLLMYAAQIGEENGALAATMVLLFVLLDIFMWRYGLKKIKEHRQKDSMPV
ncbi:MAG: PrsW family glutamic-type intramembrane protease [Flavobacteriales bacterium]